MEQLHDEVGDAARVHPEVEDGDRVRVLHAAGRGPLAPEAGERLGVGAGAGGQHLHRHLAVELEVPRAEDRPEAAAADQRVEPVAPGQDRPRHRLGRVPGLDRGRRLRLHGLPRAQVRADAREGHRVVDRLRHVVVGAQRERLHDVLAVRLRGHHDDGQRRRRGRQAHGLEDVEPGHARHHDVEEHEVHRRAPEQLQRLGPAGGRDDAEAGPLQAPRHEVAVRREVVHHEDRGRLAHGSAFGGRRRAGLEVAGGERPAEPGGERARGRGHRREVDAGLDPHPVEHVQEVLGGQVPRRAGRVGASPEAAGGAVDDAHALLQRRQHVGEGRAARVVEVHGEAIRRDRSLQPPRDVRHLCRHRDPDGIPDRHLVAAGVHQPPRHVHDPLRGDRRPRRDSRSTVDT